VLTLLSAAWGAIHQWVQSVRTAGVDDLCPFGAVESYWSLLTNGAYLKRVTASSLVLLVETLLLTLIFRRAFCGQICPLGFLQELFGKLGRKLFGKRRPQLWGWVDRLARNLKYLVLVGVAILSWVLGELIVRPYDPWASWMHLTSPELFAEMGWGFAILILGLLGSLFEERSFCRYACPLGAFLGGVSKLGLVRVARNHETCIHCSRCTKFCPVNISVEHLNQVTTAECLSCGLCVSACPVPYTLNFALPSKNMPKVPAWVVSVGSVVLLTVVIGLGILSRHFSFLQQTTEERVLELAQQGAGFDSSLIKGRDHLETVSRISGISLDLLIERSGVSPQDVQVPIKELGAKYPSVTPESVRELVDALLASDGTSQPKR